MESFAFVDRQTVTWRDLDAMGHVNNAVYLTYCETARLRYLQHVLNKSIYALSLVVVRSEINYRTPARLGDKLSVGVRVSEIGRSSFILEHRIEQRNDGRLVADSTSTIAHLNDDATASTPLPQPLVAKFAAFDGLDVDASG